MFCMLKILFWAGAVVICSAVCLPNQLCTSQSGHISHSDSNIQIIEKLFARERTWQIRPGQMSTTILLAFQNFKTRPSTIVTVIMVRADGQFEAKQFQGDLGNFELVAENLIAVLVKVPIGSGNSANFTLKYYAGCQYTQENHIKYPEQFVNPTKPTSCWIIKPLVEGARKRFYFTFRQLQIQQGHTLKLWNVHTEESIGQIQNASYFETFAAEANSRNVSQIFMLEFQCKTADCNSNQNSFFASVYAMADEDIECIEIQRGCSWFAHDLPVELCDVPCPAYEKMLEHEYRMEYNKPTLRTGISFGVIKKTKKAERKGKLCDVPRYRHMCQCPRSTNLIQFCYTSKPCIQYNECTWACVFMRILQCKRIKILQTVELL